MELWMNQWLMCKEKIKRGKDKNWPDPAAVPSKSVCI